jgi:hypothetical protein
MKLRPKSGIRRIRCNTCKHVESSNVGLGAPDVIAFRHKHKGHEIVTTPMYETSPAWRTILAVKNAERAVVRAGIRLVNVAFNRGRPRNSQMYLRDLDGATTRLRIVVDRLLKARTADRKRKRS